MWILIHVRIKVGFHSFFFRAVMAELALTRKLSFPVFRMWLAVGEVVEQGYGHLGIAKDGHPEICAKVGDAW